MLRDHVLVISDERFYDYSLIVSTLPRYDMIYFICDIEHNCEFIERDTYRYFLESSMI